MPLRIAMTGAGSIGFTRKLVADTLTVPELHDTVFAFHDIHEGNLGRVAQVVRRDIEANHLPARVETHLDRRAAFEGADYIICTIRVGGLEAFRLDVEIPLKYGVDQCVGDTICAGGIMYAQRTIPVLLDICKDMREVAKPGATLLNYSNPMAMNCWAVAKHGGVPVIGLCHGVQGACRQIADCTTRWAQREGLIEQDEEISHKDIHFVWAGINHQTWCIEARWREYDLVPLMLELFTNHPTYTQTEKVRIDVLSRFGYYSTESNGHLSEYLPWYRKRREEIEGWIDHSHWIHGETGGYLRYCAETRGDFESEFPHWMGEPAKVFSAENRSDEHGSYIIEALETGRVYRGWFNVPNAGIIANLPDGCIVESLGFVDRNGLHMARVGDLPLACAATCAMSVRVQEMGMEAAILGDIRILKLAMLHDPLVGAVCTPPEVWAMTDEMVAAQREWLPQYSVNPVL